ncbi:MAG: vWA domain-containing protein [Tractidigestivibacter sp.]|jgi:uncharacterized protein YegL|uniref:vWA domain-containing protein n=1 Tax=Tractidigestivibacter sp. TaxID=2847320 RepID=UPI003D904B50
MNENLTELAFVLDRSGSMSGLEADTIGGYNSLLRTQKAAPGRAIVSTVLFDHEVEWLHDRMDIQKVRPITQKDYWVRGSTALLDAVGETIERIDLAHRYARSEDVPARTMVVVTTDGLENASRRFALGQVKEMIHAHERAGWEFIFLGANIDAVDVGSSMGFAPQRSVDYMSDSCGSARAFDGIAMAAMSFREDGEVAEDWRVGIDEDYERRGNKN